MKFSEFINTYSLQAYLIYCKRNSLEPDIDVKQQETRRLCALVKPKAIQQT